MRENREGRRRHRARPWRVRRGGRPSSGRCSAHRGTGRSAACPAAKPRRELVESNRGVRAGKAPSSKLASPPPGGEPLSGWQWDMAMMDATPTGSYAAQPGTHGVRVGVIDTGIQGDHPDIAPNFNAGLSRNFTTDIPAHRRRVRGRSRRLVRGPGGRRRGRPRHARGGHDRVAAERHRHRRRGPRRRAGQPARGPGLGLLLPAGDGRRAHLRRRPRDRRGEHVVLHRSVAVQLRRQPGGQRRSSRPSSGRSSRARSERSTTRAARA